MHKTSADLILGRVSNGPTLTQHWITVSTGSRDSQWYLQHDKQDTYTLSADLILGQYLRRWANNKPALGRRLMWLVTRYEKGLCLVLETSSDQIFPAEINSCNC